MFENIFCICDKDSCGSSYYPAIGDLQDCHNTIFSSEISGIILLPTGAAAPTNWQTLAGWTGVIDNSDNMNGFAKYFTGIGDVPIPQKTFIENAKGYKRITDKLYSTTIDVLSLHESMYTFLKYLQCNPRNYTFWLHTVSNHILGGATGIVPSFSQVDFPYERGEDGLQKGIVNIEWRALCDPERIIINDFETAIQNNIAPNIIQGAAANATWGNAPNEVWAV